MKKPEQRVRPRITSTTEYDESLVLLDELTKELIDFSTSNLQLQNEEMIPVFT